MLVRRESTLGLWYDVLGSDGADEVKVIVNGHLVTFRELGNLAKEVLRCMSERPWELVVRRRVSRDIVCLGGCQRRVLMFQG